ncbi:DUF2897 family protein [Aliivibrio sifiae]|jgi:hypothetical protein|uniref:DUF2897 domain-containing protein n=1 Tax=Aliivibrio sifiae TaxID=566293 RepID=A0A2S7XEL3_9GAMM|nr:DUF2897 family protein [Aliivibrio sifiae]PQJ89800.1 hypothetical protein BTO22_09490 [Aliivibrio sifiae]
MEWLMNPWVIIVIVLSVVIGNLAALKATANMKFKSKEKLYSQKNEHESSEDDNSITSSNEESITTEQNNEKKDVH